MGKFVNLLPCAPIVTLAFFSVASLELYMLQYILVAVFFSNVIPSFFQQLPIFQLSKHESYVV